MPRNQPDPINLSLRPAIEVPHDRGVKWSEIGASAFVFDAAGLLARCGCFTDILAFGWKSGATRSSLLIKAATSGSVRAFSRSCIATTSPWSWAPRRSHVVERQPHRQSFDGIRYFDGAELELPRDCDTEHRPNQRHRKPETADAGNASLIEVVDRARQAERLQSPGRWNIVRPQGAPRLSHFEFPASSRCLLIIVNLPHWRGNLSA